ncbi:hypothetical protein HK100_010228 [Physocladia obscura]|uniref:FAD-binding domain-containing protein n=1 Tax=Physocladia obscura TaxID=109957 RepID=A0AAD5XDW4_9FUNG|nr:hypothetical protein HK100_010228 [Physocladia obscura]
MMQILISGAGIAGPTLAFFLAKAGIRVCVVETAASLLSHGQNIDIQGSARMVIKNMGLLEEVRKLNTTETGTQFIGRDGNPFAFFPVNNGNSASLTSEFEILRGDLAAIFYRATKDNPNVEYLFDTQITRMLSNDENAVRVELSNGQVREFDVLAAADGQWSKVRKLVFPPESVKSVDFGMYVAYWTVPREKFDNDWWNIYQALDSRIITIRPDPHGTVRAMFTRMPRSDLQKAEWLAASKSGKEAQQELLRKDFADAGWQAQRLLNSMNQAPDFYFQAIKQIKMAKWSRGRVVCVGDTAYAPTPLTGMGTSLAITGAYILAGELSKLNEGEHPSTAFDNYEKAFRAFVEEIQQVPSIVPGIAHPTGELGRLTFHAIIWSISKVVGLPVIANKFDDGNAEDFKLPQYPKV